MNPITGIDCCARAANGHTAMPLRRVMNSRRLIVAPEVRTGVCIENLIRSNAGRESANLAQ